MTDDRPPGPETPLRRWLETLAAPSPAPAGGAAAAVAGALAAALAAMVSSLTVAREKYAEFRPEARTILEESNRLREALAALAERDSEVYGTVIAALLLPQEDDAQIARRAAARGAALMDAAQVQVDVLAAAAAVGRLARRLVERGLSSAIADAAAAAFLAAAVARTAYWNIRVDLQSLQHDGEARAILHRALDTLENVEAVEQQVRRVLSDRVR